MKNLFLERFQELLNEKFNGNKANLSKVTGISAPTLSQYFPPRSSSPSAKQLFLLADAFGCSIDYLVGREDDFGNVPVKSNLSAQEQELLSAFSKLDVVQRETVLIQIKAVAKVNA